MGSGQLDEITIHQINYSEKYSLVAALIYTHLKLPFLEKCEMRHGGPVLTVHSSFSEKLKLKTFCLKRLEEVQ